MQVPALAVHAQWQTPDLQNWTCFSLACAPLPRACLHPRQPAWASPSPRKQHSPGFFLAKQPPLTGWLRWKALRQWRLLLQQGTSYCMAHGLFLCNALLVLLAGPPTHSCAHHGLENRQHKWAKDRQHPVCVGCHPHGLRIHDKCSSLSGQLLFSTLGSSLSGSCAHSHLRRPKLQAG